MKIALIYDCIYPYVKGGGEKRYFEIAQRLKNKHEVHLFGMKFWQGNNIIKQNGVYLHGVCKALKLYSKEGRRNFIQPIYFAFKLIRPLFKEKFDVIDCAAFPYFSVFPVWLYSKFKKVPLVVTWFEFWGESWNKYLGSLGFIGRIIEKLVLKLSPNIISISELTKQRINKPNIKVLPVGIEYDDITKINSQIEKYDIIFAGRFIKEKNIDLLIKAIKLVQKEIINIRCLVIGEGPEKDKLQELVNRYQLNKNISFKNFLENKQDLFSYLKSAKLFVLPSTREGFGITLCEANACGVPVIAINHQENAAKDLIKDNYNGFIANFDEFDLAAKIIKFLRDKNSYPKFKKQAITEAKKYDWQNIILDLEKYYQNIYNK